MKSILWQNLHLNLMMELQIQVILKLIKFNQNFNYKMSLEIPKKNCAKTRHHKQKRNHAEAQNHKMTRTKTKIKSFWWKAFQTVIKTNKFSCSSKYTAGKTSNPLLKQHHEQKSVFCLIKKKIQWDQNQFQKVRRMICWFMDNQLEIEVKVYKPGKKKKQDHQDLPATWANNITTQILYKK